MKPEDIAAILPSGADKPAVTAADGVVSLTYTVESLGHRGSLDDLAIRERFAVLSAEQTDNGVFGGDGRLIQLHGATVRYALAPKPASKPTTKANG